MKETICSVDYIQIISKWKCAQQGQCSVRGQISLFIECVLDGDDDSLWDTKSILYITCGRRGKCTCVCLCVCKISLCGSKEESFQGCNFRDLKGGLWHPKKGIEELISIEKAGVSEQNKGCWRMGSLSEPDSSP